MNCSEAHHVADGLTESITCVAGKWEMNIGAGAELYQAHLQSVVQKVILLATW